MADVPWTEHAATWLRNQAVPFANVFPNDTGIGVEAPKCAPTKHRRKRVLDQQRG